MIFVDDVHYDVFCPVCGNKSSVIFSNGEETIYCDNCANQIEKLSKDAALKGSEV